MTTQTFTAWGLFLEGLLSFFSPCVLPLIPLYIGYLTSSGKNKKNSKIHTAVMTFFFILGICTVFFIAGLGAGALSELYNSYKIQFTLLSGFILIIMGLFSAGVIQIPFLMKERRIAAKFRGGIFGAWLLGFFFSFAWSPCIGPLLASAILASSQAPDRLTGFLYIGSYALGFILIFILLGLFTDFVLDLLKKHGNIVKYTGKVGAAAVLIMGCCNLYSGFREIRQLSSGNNTAAAEQDIEALTDLQNYGFALPDGEGNVVDIRDYAGRTIVVDFFGTWCYYCNEELPYLQEVNDTMDDIKIILVAAPGMNGEGTSEEVEKYMADKGYDMTVIYDTDFSVSSAFGISGYPTTYFFKPDESCIGYVPGYVTEETFNEILQQCRE